MLARPDVTDNLRQRPGELCVETRRGRSNGTTPPLDEATPVPPRPSDRGFVAPGISREHPLPSATLPDGARVQVVPPGHAGADGDRDPQARLARAQAGRLCRGRRLRRHQGARGAGAIAGRPGAVGAARRRRHIRHAGGRRQGAQEHHRLGRHLERQDHLPERFDPRDSAAGAADPDRGHARALRRPRKCRRPAGGAQRARRGAGDRQRLARRIAQDAARRIILGELRGTEASPSCARSIPATRDR